MASPFAPCAKCSGPMRRNSSYIAGVSVHYDCTREFAVRTGICDRCGDWVEILKDRQPGPVRCHACRRAEPVHRGTSLARVILCAICSQQIVGGQARPGARHRECMKAETAARVKATRRGGYSFACERCGKVCERSGHSGPMAKWCSNKCAVGASWTRRHMRERDAFVEDVPPYLVFERDGFVCQLCGEQLDMLAKVPELLAPTIDHVVPLSRGGKHEMSNAQSAHYSCNARKGDRVA